LNSFSFFFDDGGRGLKSVGLPLEEEEVEGFGGGAPNLGREEEEGVVVEEEEERRERKAD